MRNMNKNCWTSQRGFTMIQAIIVILVITALFWIFVPTKEGRMRARGLEIKSPISNETYTALPLDFLIITEKKDTEPFNKLPPGTWRIQNIDKPKDRISITGFMFSAEKNSKPDLVGYNLTLAEFDNGKTLVDISLIDRYNPGYDKTERDFELQERGGQR